MKPLPPYQNRTAPALFALLLAFLSVSVLRAEDDAKKFALTSPAFADGGTLADSTVLNGLDCHGPNRSPALAWKNIPVGTKSFVLICDDFEARGGDGFIHWVAYNIPATVDHLAENAGATEPELTGGGRHAYNDFLRRRYDGPCPPEGAPHKYRFTIFALSIRTIDDAGAHDLAQTAFRHPRPDPRPGLAHRTAPALSIARKITAEQQSVTHVLTQKRYRCPDCASLSQ